MLRVTQVSTNRRWFQTTSVASSLVKKKLNILLHTGRVPKGLLTPAQRRREAEAAALEAAARQTRRLNKNHALEILQTKLQMPITDYDQIHEMDLPTADDFHKRLAPTERRVLYNVLGTSGDQLKDSFVVEKDILRFLRKGHVNKALYVARLAGTEGVVGMNRVMEWLLENGRFNAALDVFSKRKKWGVAVNDLTYTILFAGGGRGAVLTAGQAERLAKVYIGSVSKGWNVQHFNSCLAALFNSEKPERAWEVFHFAMALRARDGHPEPVGEIPVEPLLKGEADGEGLVSGLAAKNLGVFQPTPATFSIIFKYLRNLKEVERAQRAEVVWAMVQGLKGFRVDPQLALAYAGLFGGRRSLEVLAEWFEVPANPKAPTDTTAPVVVETAPTGISHRRFPADPHLMQLYLNLTASLYSPAVACTVFQKWITTLPMDLDVVLYDTYLRHFTAAYAKKESFPWNEQFAQFNELREQRMYAKLEMSEQIITTGLMGHLEHLKVFGSSGSSSDHFSSLQTFLRLCSLQPRRNRQLVTLPLSLLHWYFKSLAVLHLSPPHAETTLLQFFNLCERSVVALGPLLLLKTKAGFFDTRAYYTLTNRIHARDVPHLPSRIRDISITVCTLVKELAASLPEALVHPKVLSAPDYDSEVHYKLALLEYQKRLSRHTRVLEAVFFKKRMEPIEECEAHLAQAQALVERFILHRLGVKPRRSMVADLAEEIQAEVQKAPRPTKLPKAVVYTPRPTEA